MGQMGHNTELPSEARLSLDIETESYIGNSPNGQVINSTMKAGNYSAVTDYFFGLPARLPPAGNSTRKQTAKTAQLYQVS